MAQAAFSIVLRMASLAIITCGFLGSTPTALAEDRDAPELILKNFGDQCSLTGRWTNQALSLNSRLVGIVKQLQSNQKCAHLTPALQQLMDASGKIDQALTTYQKSDLMKYEDRLLFLESALSTATDPDLVLALDGEILNTQLNLILARGDSSAYDRLRKNDLAFQNAQSLNKGLADLLTNSQGVMDCLADHPDAAVQLTTAVIAASASFVNPLLGAGAAVVGGLINTGINALREWELSQAIRRANEPIIPVAMGCALETMTRLYCQIGDEFEIINQQQILRQKTELARRSNQPAPGTSSWLGLDLVGRQIPILARWLQSVKTGGKVRSDADAGNQNNIDLLRADIRIVKRSIDGQIEQAKDDFERLGDQEVISQRKLILDLLESISLRTGLQPPLENGGNGGTTYHPSLSFVDFDKTWHQIVCLLLNVPFQKPNSRELSSVREYIKARFVTDSTESVALKQIILNLQQNFNDNIFTPAQNQNEARARLRTTEDLEELLDSAFLGRLNEPSPYETLISIKGYLEEAKSRFAQTQYTPGVLEPTLTSVSRAIEALKQRLETDRTQTTGEIIEAVKAAFDLTRLEVTFFRNRLEAVIREDGLMRLHNGEFTAPVSELLNTWGGNLIHRLLDHGVIDHSSAADQMNAARPIISGTIREFNRRFKSLLKEAVNSLYQRGKEEGEELDPRWVMDPRFGGTGSFLDFLKPHVSSLHPVSRRPNFQNLAQLCLLILSTNSDWPDSEIANCNQMVYFSQNFDIQGHPSPAVKIFNLKSDLDASRIPMQDRYCQHYRIVRNQKLADVLYLNSLNGRFRYQ